MNSGKQCVNSDFCLYTVNPCEITVHVQKKKKKEDVKVNMKQSTQSKHSRHNVNSRRLN